MNQQKAKFQKMARLNQGSYAEAGGDVNGDGSTMKQTATAGQAAENLAQTPKLPENTEQRGPSIVDSAEGP